LENGQIYRLLYRVVCQVRATVWVYAKWLCVDNSNNNVFSLFAAWLLVCYPRIRFYFSLTNWWAIIYINIIRSHLVTSISLLVGCWVNKLVGVGVKFFIFRSLSSSSALKFIIDLLYWWTSERIIICIERGYDCELVNR